jgi:hypothetical protein
MRSKPEPRTSGTAASSRSQKRSRNVVRRGSEAADLGLATARTLVSDTLGMVRVARVGARKSTSALQILPDSTLRGLAASSIGLGAGFYLAGVPRLVTAAAMTPAMVIGAAILLRPGDEVTAPEAAR